MNVLQAKQVEEHLGLPLGKGRVRTSDWSKPLDEEQKTYAADDAYAGFMLYHCMNAMRVGMDPVPPLPRLADTYIPMRTWPYCSIQLEPSENGVTTTAYQFYMELNRRLEEKKAETMELVSLARDMENSEEEVPLAKIRDKSRDLKLRGKDSRSHRTSSIDAATPKELYDRLVERRKELAAAQKVPAFCVAANTVLEDLARLRPATKISMLKVKGIGKEKPSKYGTAWLEIITQFLNENETEASSTAGKLPPRFSVSSQSSKTSIRAKGNVAAETIEIQQALVSLPQVHTGLSFSMASAEIEDEEDEHNLVVTGGSDGSSAFRAILAAQSASALKRKRSSPSLDRNFPTPSAHRQSNDQTFVESRILANKLTALARKVTSQLNLKDASSVASDVTIRRIVELQNVTAKELYHIPGILHFVEACAKVGLNLFGIIVKFKG